MDSSTQQIWAAVLSSAGLFAFLGIVAQGIGKHVSGTAGRERLRNMGMKEQRNEAWAEANRADATADREAINRRRTEEYASGLRRDLIELGVPEEHLRPWPELKKAPPEKETK